MIARVKCNVSCEDCETMNYAMSMMLQLFKAFRDSVPTCAVENATITVCFENDHKVCKMAQTDLLQLNELPFESFDDLKVGCEVLAP